ncbi:sel1 repeat family protein [Cupriavidus necator]|uniref:Sel1 repeat family protein n=1 Tax=Cupriavidus necator TaxID=106590 RepID=A0A2P1DV00_CUPNE|nr:sel1 repeat family protein [Cupriavidus necator]AVK72204.1 sel1 repeat family protein [Cupriavidus necator]
MRTALAVLLAALAVAACSRENPLASLPDLSAVRANLAFNCTHEADHLPTLDPQADSLFRYGQYLEKKDGPKNFNEVARYYRIAAAHGHYKANHNLQMLVSEGSAASPAPEKESIVLAEQLIEAGVPSGYYDIGHYLLHGYGLKQDEDMARRFIRKSADLGNAEAQYYVANLLAPADMAPDIAKQMRQCAMDQGHGDAAGSLGINFKNNSLYTEAVKAFQKGVAAGNTQAAFSLESGFKGPPSSDRLNYLALSSDAERVRRYELIGKFIDDNDGRNPKVPDVDQIVPLPPANLPPWDGTFQWQKEQDAAVPPERPSDELINRLSKAKNLDPATGLPLAAPARTAQSTPSEADQKLLPLVYGNQV